MRGLDSEDYIPCPPTASRRLFGTPQAPGFFENTEMTRDQFATFRELVHASAEKHLDYTKPATQQNQRQLKAHLREVARNWDFKNAFEDDWPILHYTKYYVWRMREPKAIERARARDRCQHAVPDARKKSSRREPRSLTPEVLPPPAPEVPPPSASEAAEHVPTAQTGKCTAGVHPVHDPSTPVREFLSALEPSMSTSTIDRLIELGIKNMDRLKMLARKLYRDEWVNKYVDMDRFEFSALQTALNELAGCSAA